MLDPDLSRRLRHALFWERVRIAMLLVAAIASLIVAIDAILGWLS